MLPDFVHRGDSRNRHKKLHQPAAPQRKVVSLMGPMSCLVGAVAASYSALKRHPSRNADHAVRRPSTTTLTPRTSSLQDPTADLNAIPLILQASTAYDNEHGFKQSSGARLSCHANKRLTDNTCALPGISRIFRSRILAGRRARWRRARRGRDGG